MSRKALLLGLGIVLLAGTVAASLVGLVRHEPEWFVKSAVPQSEERRKESGAFQSDFANLLGRINAQTDFYAQFTDLRINSYLEEDFVRSGVAKTILPEGVSQPRIAIEPDKIRFAFRYGRGLWSTVISIDLRVWLVAKERNVVALELQGLHAGSLPISAQSLLERVDDMAQQENMRVVWYRHNGNPVALLRFQADQPRPTIQLQQLELHQGRIVIQGRSTEGNSLQAMLPLAEITPAAH